MKAEITGKSIGTVKLGYPRAVWIVRCACGHTNRFDAFSWGGHVSLRCKSCRFYIHRYTLECTKERYPKMNDNTKYKLQHRNGSGGEWSDWYTDQSGLTKAEADAALEAAKPGADGWQAQYRIVPEGD